MSGRDATIPMRFDTLCIHGGQSPDPVSGAVMTPIVLSSTFAQDGPGGHKGWDYSRAGNPTRDTLEACLATLEGGSHAVTYASGCAATTSILLLLKSGDHVLVGDDVYGGTFRIFDKVLKQFGISATFLDLTDMNEVRAAVLPSTRMIWLETPSNPLLKIFDIAALAEVAREKKVWLAVDNTFATPALQRPLDLGATMAVHSSTKYLNGHSDIVGGAVVTRDAELGERLHFVQKAVGAVPSPFDCYLLLRGLKTLHLRMRQHVAAAEQLAAWLAIHKQVERVYYPGLDTHPGHAIAARQMRAPGGIVSFEIKGGLPASEAFLRELKVFTCAESLGGVESLADHPALMTHASLDASARKALGIHDGLVRLSVGIEDLNDLEDDLGRALEKAGAAAIATSAP